MNVHYPELFSTESIIKIISNIQLLNDHLIGGRSTTLHSRMEDSKTKLGIFYLVSREGDRVTFFG